MKRRIVVQVVAGTVVTVFAAGTWLTGGTPNPGLLRFFSAAVFIAVGVLAVWDHWLWHLGWIQRLRGAPRDLRGTWKGTLESFWTDPATGSPPPAKTVYLVIQQSASTLAVVMLTNESKSKSSLATISDDGVSASLDYMYLNRPKSRFEHRSRMHHGSTSLDIVGRPVVRLRGNYWTSRDSRGELELLQRVSTLAEDFDQAEALFAAADTGIAPRDPAPDAAQGS